MDNQRFIEKNKNLFAGLIIVLIVFLASLIVLTGVNIVNHIKEGKYIGQGIEVKNTISVSGKGEIYAKPDLALITFSVKNEAKEVSEAMRKNTEKMNAVISFIKEQGVEEKDLKTTSFNIYPRYEYRKDEREGYFYPQGKRVLVGYEVIQSLQVKIRDLTKIGAILEGATSKGANLVGNLQFTIDKQEELKAKAREEAIKRAKDKAKEIASQLGVRLLRITSFRETTSVPRYYRGLKEVVGMGGGEEVIQPQIEAGENKIEVNVSITYEIR